MMSNDELLAKLYDNTLTDTERIILHQRMEESPELATEVKELDSVMNLLEDTKHVTAENPAVFKRTKNVVLGLMAGVAATSTIAAGSSTTLQAAGAGIAQWAIGAIGVLAVGGVAVWQLNSEPETPKEQEPSKDTEQVQQTTQEDTQAAIPEQAISTEQVKEQGDNTESTSQQEPPASTQPAERTPPSVVTDNTPVQQEPVEKDNSNDNIDSAVNDESTSEDGHAFLDDERKFLLEFVKPLQERLDLYASSGQVQEQLNLLPKIIPTFMELQDFAKVDALVMRGVELAESQNNMNEKVRFLLLGLQIHIDNKNQEQEILYRQKLQTIDLTQLSNGIAEEVRRMRK